MDLQQPKDLLLASFWSLGKVALLRGGYNVNLIREDVNFVEDGQGEKVEISQSITKTDQGSNNLSFPFSITSLLFGIVFSRQMPKRLSQDPENFSIVPKSS